MKNRLSTKPDQDGKSALMLNHQGDDTYIIRTCPGGRTVAEARFQFEAANRAARDTIRRQQMAFGDNGELMTLEEFMEAFGSRRVIEVGTERDAAGNSPWIVIRSGRFTVVLVPQDLDGEYLDIDAHPFVDGLGATASVFAMSDGRDVPGLAPTGTTSYKRPSAQLVALIVGEQGTDEP